MTSPWISSDSGGGAEEHSQRLRRVRSKKGENPAHLESSVHQDVHVGSAADRSSPATSLRSRGQEEAAGRGQPGVRGWLS